MGKNHASQYANFGSLLDCIYYFVLIGIGLGSKSFWAINQGISFRHRGIQAQQINIVNIGKIPPPQKY